MGGDGMGFAAFAFVVMVLAVVGVGALLTDNRHFSTIVKDCESKGYIQNDTTRVFCQVEKQK